MEMPQTLCALSRVEGILESGVNSWYSFSSQTNVTFYITHETFNKNPHKR